MAGYTDRLITINEEDFVRAGKFPVRGRVCRVHGVGIDCDRFLPAEQREAGDGDFLKDRDVSEKEAKAPRHTEFTVATVGELAPGKNHQAVIRALPYLPDVRYEIYGEGSCMKSLMALAKECGVEDQVYFAGYCNDIPSRLCQVDAFVFLSLREGLPVAVMEAMAAGLPVIALDIRGCRELVVDGKGGFLLKSDEPEMVAQSIGSLQRDKELGKRMGAYNQRYIKAYDKTVVREEMREIYRELLQ